MRARSSFAVIIVLALGAGPGVAGCFDFGNHGSSTGGGGGGTGSTGTGPEVTGSLGTFDADAKIVQTSCGVGALGMANEWTFVVGLGRDEKSGACTWDVGAGPIAGMCDAKGEQLAFDAKFVIDMRKGDDGTHPACSIERHDIASANIDDPENPTRFTGTLTYTFTPTIGSNCIDFVVGSTKQFLTLPCEVQYAVTAKRRDAE